MEVGMDVRDDGAQSAGQWSRVLALSSGYAFH